MTVDLGISSETLKQLGDLSLLTVNKTFPYFVKTQLMYGIIYLSITLILTIAALFFIKAIIKENKKEENKDSNVIAGFGFASFSLISLGLLAFYLGINHIINPQYYAINEMVKLIR